MDYTELITAEHADKPRFKAMVSLVSGAFGANSDVFAQIVEAFDLDTAIGNQLDVIGQWVGISRYVQTPLAVYFSLDTAGLGFDQGSWQGPYDPTQGLTSLDDETYRRMIRAKIGANNWDGTLTEMQSILAQVFSGTSTRIFAADNQDMTMGVYLAGTYPSAVMQSLLKNGYLPLKPEGVKLDYFKVSIEGDAFFGFDLSNQYVAGFNTGAWGVSL